MESVVDGLSTSRPLVSGRGITVNDFEIGFLFHLCIQNDPTIVLCLNPEVYSMKTTVGVLAVLLLAATVAMGQDYQPKPFPQEANTALNNTYEESSPAVVVVVDQSELPSSMAANQDSANVEISMDRHDRADLGSPFPSAANPSGEVSSDRIGTDADYQESPFPSAANPSRNW